MRRLAFAAVAMLAAAGIVLPPEAPGLVAPAVAAAAAVERFVAEPNLGQADAAWTHVARVAGLAVSFRAGGFAFATPDGVVVQATLVEARPAPPVAQEPLPGVSNYLLEGATIPGVPRFAKLVYEDAWPGLDLVFRASSGGSLEYDLLAAPGAGVGRFALAFDHDLTLLPGGSLSIADVVHEAPVAWQVGPERLPVAAAFELRGAREVGFRLGPLDPSLPTVVDPVVTFSTYIAGGLPIVRDVDAHADGSTYVGGLVNSIIPASPGAYETTATSYPAGYVTRLLPSGAHAWSTYVSALVSTTGLAVEPSGHVVAVGGTGSVIRLTPDGTAATFFVSPPGFSGGGLAVADGKAYVGGQAYGGFPATPGWSSPDVGGPAVLVIDTATGAIVAGWAYGLSKGPGHALDVAVDSAGRIHVAGYTTVGSGDYHADVFVARMAFLGPLDYAVTLASNEDEFGYGVAADALGRSIVVGFVTDHLPHEFPLFLAMDATADAHEAFVARINPDGSLSFSTFLGGNGADEAHGVSVLDDGRIVVSGWTGSADFPVVNAVQPVKAGDFLQLDAFVTVFHPSGLLIDFSTFWGGTRMEWHVAGHGTDAAGTIHLAGGTWSLDFPTTPDAPWTSGGSYAWRLQLDPPSAPPACEPLLGICL